MYRTNCSLSLCFCASLPSDLFSFVQARKECRYLSLLAVPFLLPQPTSIMTSLSSAAEQPPSSTTPSPPLPPARETRQDSNAWLISFGAAMVPFLAFLYGHQRGLTVRAINAVVRSPIGAPGLLLLPFGTLAAEKSVYDTVQAAQGIDPYNARGAAAAGGFPSGGAALPSFSLIPVQRHNLFVSLLPRATKQG